MVFKVVQKIKGNYYLYEAEGYWDPETKKTKQIRKYIGKCDENGNLTQEKTSQRTFSASKTFGPYYLLLELASQSGLYDKLTKAHGEDADKLMALAIMRIVHPSSLRHIQTLMEESFLPEMLELDAEFFSSQNLSRFLKSIYKNSKNRYSFLSSQISNDDVLIYDITGFDSLTKLNEYVEHGRNYQSTNMMQMNLGLVHSLDTDIPVYYKVFPGSIRDVSTLSNLVSEVRELGVGDSHFLIDRGFFSAFNLNGLTDCGIGFTIPGTYANKSVRNLVSECFDEIEDSDRRRMFKGKSIGIYESSIKVGKYRYRSIAYYEKSRDSVSDDAFFGRLTDLEETYNGKNWNDELIKEITGKKGLVSLLEFTNDKGKIKITRNKQLIDEYIKRHGIAILLTTSDDSWDTVLSRYRHRNDAEEEFRMLKSSMEGGVKYLSSKESVEGMLYIEFIALILRTILLNKMRKENMLTNVWIPDIISEMNKLKVGKIGDIWRLNELTKKQKELLKKLAVKQPDSSCYELW